MYQESQPHAVKSFPSKPIINEVDVIIIVAFVSIVVVYLANELVEDLKWKYPGFNVPVFFAYLSLLILSIAALVLFLFGAW